MKRKVSALLASVILLATVLCTNVSALTTKWMSSSTYGDFANHQEALNEVRSLMLSQTTADRIARFDLILKEYPLSGFFNSLKNEPCKAHCGTCNGGTLSDTCINQIYDSETGKTVCLYAWQCYGFARYCSYRFFGSIFKGEGTAVSSASLSSVAKFKEYLDSYDDFTGAHLRVNGSHSLVYLARTEEYIYFIDANSGIGSLTGWMGRNCSNNSEHSQYCCKINLRRMTYEQFLKKYGSTVVVYHNEKADTSGNSTVSITHGYTGVTNEITNSNATLYVTINKPSAAKCQKFGIRIRKTNGYYKDEWDYIYDAMGTGIGNPAYKVWFDLNEELFYTLEPATSYTYQIYALVDGKEYFSTENSFTTTGSTVNQVYKLISSDGYQTIREHAYTTSAKIYDITTPTYVTVTKYTDDSQWGYISYNGYNGWIKLDEGANVIKHTAHTYGSWSTTSNATCTAAGSQERTCACGASETQSIPALDHNWSSSWTIDVAATCTTAGSKSHHCTRCTAKNDVTVIPKLDHTFGVWQTTSDPTCAVEGSQSRLCGKCGAVETQAIPTIDHIWSNEWTVESEPNCTVAGVKSRLCIMCGAKDTDLIPAKGHEVIVDVWDEPTCTENGTLIRYCAICAPWYEMEYPPALGHDWESEWTIEEETCTESGSRYHRCTRCDEKNDLTETPALGHDWESELTIDTAPTCTTAGSKSRHCSRCEETTEITDIPAAGHSYGDWNTIVASTCLKSGLERRTCSGCSKNENRVIPSGHSFGEWEMLAEPTESSQGFRSRYCAGCGEEELEMLNMIGDLDGDGVLGNSDITMYVRMLGGFEFEYVDICVDFTGDGRINNRDIIAVIRKVAGWEK